MGSHTLSEEDGGGVWKVQGVGGEEGVGSRIGCKMRKDCLKKVCKK